VIDEHVEIRMVENRALVQKIQKVKNILGHSHPNISTADLFEKLCDEFLVKCEEQFKRAARKDAVRRDPVEEKSADIKQSNVPAGPEHAECNEKPSGINNQLGTKTIDAVQLRAET
jgi:hypothetical protein